MAPAKAKAAPKRSEERPNWPAFEPSVPREDLSLYELVPGQIITISNFWTGTLCKKYVSFLASLPLTTTPGKPKKGEAVRVNDRFQIDDALFAERLWSETGMKELVLDEQRQQLWGGEVLGLNPNIRIYRYRKGQFFDQHYDESNMLMFPSQPAPVSAKTSWTLLLYLTSPATGCKGGETVFYPDDYDSSKSAKKGKKQQPPPEPIAVGLETGMALLHKHGQDCMLHEGREVTEGEKWVIRSDLCIKR